MKTKQEYINEKVKSWNDRIESEKSRHKYMIKHLKERIENLKNLSDEEYEKILEEEMKHEDVDKKMNEILSEIDLTLEEYDNMSGEGLALYAKSHPELPVAETILKLTGFLDM